MIQPHVWTYRALVPPQVLVYAAFRSNATGLFQPCVGWRRVEFSEKDVLLFNHVRISCLFFYYMDKTLFQIEEVALPDRCGIRFVDPQLWGMTSPRDDAASDWNPGNDCRTFAGLGSCFILV